MDIAVRFTIGSEEGVNQLLMLQKAQIKGRYENVTSAEQLNNYISEHLNHRNTINELNDLSTQLLILFVEDKPAGYTIIRNSFQRPAVLEGKRVINYASFYILPEYDSPETRQALWKKCLSIVRTFDEALWIETLENDPLIPFFEESGFAIHEKSVMEPFGQASVTLIKYNH
ncbi:hypothetical protein [Elizabethkingia anophelis]|uniref:hypothetical protein n=1 Tax=Elizabethkingia anophelis TaxID=1117645 RepID=UPI000442AE4F|nr:hypothetical protein [Elizabethkingia anophelis]CDN72925.1 conserved hypothetical protein [Elizabethkingia anophelis]CDN78801.1 conserved hypothetical protein [Elizabethkingia anophelis]